MVKEYEPIYTVKEVSKILKVNTNAVYEYMNTGKLPYLNLGSRKVRGRDLELFINRFPEGEVMQLKTEEADSRRNGMQVELAEREKTEQEAENLIQQGRYQEACRVLDRLSAIEDVELLSRKDIRPVLHNGKVTGWEVGAINGQA